MKVLWVFLKLGIIIAVALYLENIDGYLNLVWGGYYIDMSATVFAICLLVLCGFIWKMAKISAFTSSVPRVYFLNRKKDKLQQVQDSILDGETAFYNKDIHTLDKNIKKVKKILGDTHHISVLMTIQLHVLEKKFSNALIEYKNSIGSPSMEKAGHILHKSGHNKTILELLDIQQQNHILQDWAYVLLANKSDTFEGAIAHIDLGVKSKAINFDRAIVEKSLLAVKFSEKTAVSSIVSAWKKTENLSLLPGFKILSKHMSLKDYKFAEKTLNKDSNPYTHLALSYMACGAGIWGLSRSALKKAKDGVPDMEYYKALAIIEKSEKGSTDMYIDILKKIESAL